jgi:hypothetical protein
MPNYVTSSDGISSPNDSGSILREVIYYNRNDELFMNNYTNISETGSQSYRVLVVWQVR